MASGSQDKLDFNRNLKEGQLDQLDVERVPGGRPGSHPHTLSLISGTSH